MSEKTVGYLLLLAGILVMFGALIEVLLVFTGKVNPIPVFSIEAPKLSLSSFMPQLPTGMTLPTNDASFSPIKTKDFDQIINLSATLFLMGFLLSFGYKIASLGVMMLRPITVKVSGKTDLPQQATQ